MSENFKHITYTVCINCAAATQIKHLVNVIYPSIRRVNSTKSLQHLHNIKRSIHTKQQHRTFVDIALMSFTVKPVI